MLLFQIFLHQEVKRNQNIMKTPFWGSLQKLDLSVNPQPSKNAYTRLSRLFQFQALFGVFLLFLDIKIKFIQFTSCCPFFKVVCYFIQREKQRLAIHFFNCTGFPKASSLSHPFFISGDFFYRSGCSHPFFQRLYRTIFDSSYLLRSKLTPLLINYLLRRP